MQELRAVGGTFGEAIGLVVDEEGHIPQPVSVLAAVVGAEEQLSAVGEPHEDEGLSPAAIAAIGGGQSWQLRRACHGDLPGIRA